MQKGFIALISVLVVSAIGVAVGLSLILLGLSSSQTSFAFEQSGEAKALADACVEEALQRVRDSLTFSGVGNLILGQGFCEYEVINNGGQNRNIHASSTVGSIIRRVEVNIDTINPHIEISSWQEVADF